jgi:TonB-dependent receptor
MAPTLPLRVRLLAVVLFGFSAVAFAAEVATGVVTGRITNQATGDVLVNAVVSVDGTDARAVADIDGRYRLNLPAGAQSLVISYPGLDAQRLAVDVAPGQQLVRDAALSSSLYQMDRYVVKGLREGQAAAIQEERQAANVRTVAALDAFGNPAAAVGEMLQRLPGVAVDGAGGEVGAVYIRGMTQDFSSLLIDGAQIAVSGGTAISNGNVYFGQVSTGTLASVEIVKSPTPDMDGNAIAGYMNLRTKRAYDRTPGRLVTLTAGTAWARSYQDSSVPYKDHPELDLVNLSYSDVFSVFGGKNNLGVVGTFMRNIGNGLITEVGPRQAAAAQNAYFTAAPVGNAPLEPLLRAYGAGQWGSVGHQSPALNLGLNADYKLSENTTVYVKSTYSRNKRRSGSWPSYFRWKLTTAASAANFLPGSTYDLLDARNGTVDLESVVYLRESESTTISGGVEQKLFDGTGKLNVDFNYSKNRTMYPQLNQLFARLTGVSWRLDRRGRDDWAPLVVQTGGPDWTDPASYAIRPDSQLISYSAPARRWGERADLQKDFLTRFPTTVKIGLKQARYAQTANRDLNYYTYAGAPTTPATGGIRPWVGYNMKMSEGRYGPFPFLQLPGSGLAGDVWADRNNWRQTASDVWNTEYQSRLNDAAFDETINAAYVQGSVKLKRLRILTGVRVEETKTEGSNYLRVSNSTNSNLATATPEVNAARARDNFRGWVTQGTKYRNTFPGIHFVYDADANVQARASYSTSITRPSPINLLPTLVPNELNQTLSAGNPALKPYTSDNFDFTIAKYLSGVGQISAGVFLKEIKNYFRTFQTTVPSGSDNGFGGEYAGWTLTQNRNIGSARIRGIELNHQQQFTFLPGFWRGFGSFVNYTYLETKGDFGAATGTTTRLPNLTPHTLNAGLTYRGYGFDVRLMANYRGEFYRSSTSGNFGTGAGVLPGTMFYDVYQHSRTLWDFKLQYTVNRTYTLFFDAYNLTNDWNNNDYLHAFGREIPSYAAGPGTSFKAGVTARF